MVAWLLVGVLTLGLAIMLWRWRLAHNERAALRIELADIRANLRRARNQQDARSQTPTWIDSAFDALILVDDQRRILTLNQSARDLFGPTSHPHEETLIALTRNHEIDALAEAALSGSEDLDKQFTIDDRSVRVRAQTGQAATGAWVALALQDVSELQRLSRARRDMVANISHELRTPITSIRLLVDTLMGGGLHDETQGPKLLDNIAAETSTLGQMSQELLDLSMIESGQALVRLVPKPVDVLIEQSINHLSQQAKRKNQTVTYEPCEIMVLADPEMIARVLTNLLHNAIKFAQEGGDIHVECETDQTEEAWLRISVTDDGPGIPFADRERVFERFFRSSRARSGAGTGLGLAIAKHIVEAHGGQIWVAERDIGERGAQLVFTLPLAEGEVASGDQHENA
jgi:two-component system phosphate regulon sensor histidine kinase PhoR